MMRSTQEISEETARDLVAEFRDRDGLFRFGVDSWDRQACIIDATSQGADLIARHIRQAIETDRRERVAA